MNRQINRRQINRIDKTFKILRARREAALIPYVMAGDPSLEKTGELVIEMAQQGADIIELGVPFSDPIADGPTIQRASQRALKDKASLSRILLLVADLRKRTQVPIVLMTYYNPVFKFGEERFVEEAIASGVDGLIIPDLPPEEGHTLISYSKRFNLDTIFLLAPTSTKERIKKIASASSGFIYYVSITGITGARLDDIQEVKGRIDEIRGNTTKPISVGFGISDPEQAANIARFADGVVVVSAIINKIEAMAGDPDLIKMVGEFVQLLKKGMVP